jgi:hypothetical protein
VLAWACWRNGFEPEALQLYQQAGKPPVEQSSRQTRISLRERVETLLQSASNAWRKFKSRKDFPTPTLREEVERNLPAALMLRTTAAFGDPRLTRSDLLRRYEEVLRNYPNSQERTNALAMARKVQHMIAEDAAHAQNHSKPLAELPVEEQIRELIFHLRDQYREPVRQEWACECLRSWRGTTNDPEASLLRLGYAAVPQLIETVDSETLSRYVLGEDPYPGYTCWSVGKCAEDILGQIAGRSFSNLEYTKANIAARGSLSPARNAVETWWAEFQKTGEKQMLLDGVARADEDSPAQAALLRQKYPEISTRALIDAAEGSTNAQIREQLSDQRAELGEAPGLAFLRQVMVKDPILSTRVNAAIGLFKHDPSAALGAMASEWRAFTNPQADGFERWQMLVQFFASYESIEAISVLTNGLSKRSVEVRYEVIDSLGDPDTVRLAYASGDSSASSSGAIETALVHALEDRERNFRAMHDLRVCDLAGDYLAKRWPKRYAFDRTAPLRIRDRQRIQCINVWRQAQGLPVLELPREPGVRVAAADATKVTAIVWADDSAPPDKSLLAQVAALKDKRLQAKDLVRLLTEYALHPERGSAGLEINAGKGSDLTGVQLLIKLIPGSPPPSDKSWDTNELVTLGRKQLQNGGSTFSREPAEIVEELSDLCDAAKQAIAAAPETPFEVNVRLVGSE